MSESKVRPIPAGIAAAAHINEQQYLALYRRSIETPDEFWAEQADIQVARLRKSETGRLWRRLGGVKREAMYELEVRCRRMIDEPDPVDDGLERELG